MTTSTPTDRTPGTDGDELPAKSFTGKTINEWQQIIGDWADDTFTHTGETISAHMLEKALKTHLSVTGIRNRIPASDVAGVLVLALTLLRWMDVDADDVLVVEMSKNLRARFAVDETGLSHRISP